MPVSVLKEKIADATGVPLDQQRLIFRGRVLKDDHLLSEYRILSVCASCVKAMKCTRNHLLFHLPHLFDDLYFVNHIDCMFPYYPFLLLLLCSNDMIFSEL